MKGKSSASVAAVACVATSLLLMGCGRPSNADASKGVNSASNFGTSVATLELSPNQLAAVKIEPVGTYHFPIEVEEVGSIGFAEDPATVQAESTLIGAAATFEVSNKELARARALGQTNGIAQKELDQATSDQQTAQAALKAARDAVRALGETDADINRMIAAGKIESEAPRHKWAVANVAENDSPLIQRGQPVEVRVAAIPNHTFKAKVSKIYATVDPNTHREEVRCEIEDPDDELRTGMLADFTVRIKNAVEATALPANGVVREGDGTMTAWVTTDRRYFTQRVIKTGLQENGEVQVLSGLQRGEQAVTDGAIFLDNMLQAPPSD